MSFDPKSWHADTALVHSGIHRSQYEETSEAIFMTSGYVYGSAEEAEAAFKGDSERFVYSRYANPTVNTFQDRLKILEGAEACFATASGMSAVYTAVISLLKSGDRIVANKALFGSNQFIFAEILPRFNVTCEFVNGADLDAWEKALSKPTAVVFLETPSNPSLEIIDLPAVAVLAHNAGATVVVDNVFATPCNQKPLELGADVVVYSATKHIDGQGRCLGGAILGSNEYCKEKVTPYIRNTGPCMSPFNAWILLKGLETLNLRVDRQCQSAEKIARHFEDHPVVNRIIYPHLKSHPQYDLAKAQMKQGGTIVTIDLKKGKEQAFKALNAFGVISISNNLGDAKSLSTHPATTTHQRLNEQEQAEMGITEGMIRLSVGLENVDDLIKDIDDAFNKSI